PTVNIPIEAVAQWRAGQLKPLCVFDKTNLPVKDKIAGDMSWADIPTCKSQGLDIEYLMLRGVLGGKDVFERGRHQHVAVEFQASGARCDVRRARKIQHRPGVSPVDGHGVGVESGRVGNGAL